MNSRYAVGNPIAERIRKISGNVLRSIGHIARLQRVSVIGAPLPGIGNWEEIKQSPLLWHFNFRGPDEERLVAGRE